MIEFKLYLYLERKFVNIGERLLSIVMQRVGFGEELVFDAGASDSSLFELSDKPTSVVEVPIARIGIDQNGNVRVVAHELGHVEDLSPRGLVRVAYSQLGRYAQSACPYASKASLLHDSGAQAIVSLHQELQIR